LSGVVAIAAGHLHDVALKSDSTVVAWGNNFYGQSTVPAGLSNVFAIAAGGRHTLAITGTTHGHAPVINLQPLDQAAYPGETVSFHAAANGSPAPTMQWQMSLDNGITWTDIADATASPLTFTASLEQDGNQYRAVFTNSAGSVTSLAATLSVWEPGSPVVYDDFNDNCTDPARWSFEQAGGPTLAETNHRLEITLPADSEGNEETGGDFYSWYTSACQLHGDYDMQVDYQLLAWPSVNGVVVGLGDDRVALERVSSGAYNDYDTDGEIYWTSTSLNDTFFLIGDIISTSDPSGKFRLQRVGDTINTFYYGSDAWLPVASYSDPAYAEDTPFYLEAWTGGQGCLR
jgi:hypothetical protein